MGSVYSGGLIIRRVFVSEIWEGGYFREGLFIIYLFICLFIYLSNFFSGGGLIIGILRY